MIGRDNGINHVNPVKRKMKKLVLLLLILAMAIFEPVEPKPLLIEVKPVLISKAKQWDLTKAYYQKVTMPDGSRQELKSWKALDDKGWEALAQKQWDAMKAVEVSMPENCLDCHAVCGREKP